jgi:hypothetical protein
MPNFQLNQLYDPLRQKQLVKTPEEVIRQNLVRHLVDVLGYPSSLLIIEKELARLPHLQHLALSQFPKRRADILAYFKKTETQTLEPLLLIECKATPLNPQFAQQVIGYNAHVKAPFIALANGKQVLTGFFDQSAGMYRFEKGLPTFNACLQKLYI